MINFIAISESQIPDEHSIKCKYMRAAHGYLSNTTFHGISWVLEDVSKAAKVKVENYIILFRSTH